MTAGQKYLTIFFFISLLFSSFVQAQRVSVIEGTYLIYIDFIKIDDSTYTFINDYIVTQENKKMDFVSESKIGNCYYLKSIPVSIVEKYSINCPDNFEDLRDTFTLHNNKLVQFISINDSTYCTSTSFYSHNKYGDLIRVAYKLKGSFIKYFNFTSEDIYSHEYYLQIKEYNYKINLDKNYMVIPVVIDSITPLSTKEVKKGKMKKSNIYHIKVLHNY